jgi:predicted lipid-binding transport protein (Tim44 family)
MIRNGWAAKGLIFFTVFLWVSVLAMDACARVGGGGSMGSRGSRSFSAPRSTPAPAPASPYQGAGQYGASTAPAPQPFGGGGFLRSMAGGIAGGMLGGMLFRSLGFAGGSDGMGGGFGLMDVLLIGALLYGIYWFMKRRREQAAGPSVSPYYRESSTADAGRGTQPMQAYEPMPQENDVDAGLRHIRQMDPHFDEKRFTDGCMDQFFRIQGAWANRDMSGVKNLLTEEMYGTLSREAEQLKAKGQINRLDNIAVRSVAMTELWQEGGADFVTVKIHANLLDYTADEKSGQVISGSKTEPVKFNEYWTFTRPVGDNPWRLSAINQAE